MPPRPSLFFGRAADNTARRQDTTTAQKQDSTKVHVACVRMFKAWHLAVVYVNTFYHPVDIASHTGIGVGNAYADGCSQSVRPHTHVNCAVLWLLQQNTHTSHWNNSSMKQQESSSNAVRSPLQNPFPSLADAAGPMRGVLKVKTTSGEQHRWSCVCVWVGVWVYICVRMAG